MKYLFSLLLVSSTCFAKDGFVYPCPVGMENFVCVMDADVAPANTLTSIPADSKFKDEMKMKNGKVVIDPVKKAARESNEKASADKFAADCAAQVGFLKDMCERIK